MEIIHGKQDNFNNLISSGTVLVDFFATWCGPCKMLGTVLEQLKEDRTDGKIVKIDVDECSELAKNYGVMSVPTMILFENGKMIDKKIGFMSKEEITNWIESK